MEREYLEIETPVGKHKVKLLSWLTGGEKVRLSKVDNTSFEETAKAGIEIVASGVTYEEVLEWHGQDFDFLLDAISEVIKGSSSPKAETSSANTPA